MVLLRVQYGAFCKAAKCLLPHGFNNVAFRALANHCASDVYINFLSDALSRRRWTIYTPEEKSGLRKTVPDFRF